MYRKHSKNSTGQEASSPGILISECARCGTCCRKGGPCFHLQDRLLIENGTIPSKYLYTIREGELAFDNVKGCLIPAASDIIKIKGRQNEWACIFYDEAQKGCTIYADRPLECRTLACWDTRGFERIYEHQRLTRADLIAGVAGLWDLIKDHQARCNPGEIQRLIKEFKAGQASRARHRLLEIIRYDAEIRKLVVAQGGMDAEMMEFLFGRPLPVILGNHGIRVHQFGNNRFDLSAKAPPE